MSEIVKLIKEDFISQNPENVFQNGKYKHSSSEQILGKLTNIYIEWYGLRNLSIRRYVLDVRLGICTVGCDVLWGSDHDHMDLKSYQKVGE